MTGKCKWFNAQKGFGFLTTDDRQDIFVHYTGIIMDGYKSLAEAEPVEFDVIDTDKGNQAVNVRVIE